jgi:hypothetical protein
LNKFKEHSNLIQAITKPKGTQRACPERAK